jgi:aconitate hydratase
LGLTGKEHFDIEGVGDFEKDTVTVIATSGDGKSPVRFQAKKRIDTPQEQLYFRHGGILLYVLRNMMKRG